MGYWLRACLYVLCCMGATFVAIYLAMVVSVLLMQLSWAVAALAGSLILLGFAAYGSSVLWDKMFAWFKLNKDENARPDS